MTLRVYNTSTKQKEPFIPITPPKVNMYVCGVTVYDFCHIGHARSQVVFDTIFRYMKHIGYDVTYVRNFTDVDDKIINRANETGSTPDQVASKFIDEFYVDMDALAISRPTLEPKATDHIEDIVAMVQTLVDKGFAYEVEGDVYYEVAKFGPYGKLSHRNLDDLKAGARVTVDERKRSPVDFALWKKSKPGEPSWESPWGDGRPGWHIECSVMSNKHLGPSLDIHGGGKDLVFPHHENEIAQSEAANGQEFSKYWIHNGFVNINHEKMSKSLGNFFTIRDVLKIYPPEALRLFLISSHYRSPIDYSDKALDEIMAGLDRLYSAWEILLDKAPANPPEQPGDSSKKLIELSKRMDTIARNFDESMEDDFNTAKATGHFFELVRLINTIADDKSNPEESKYLLAKADALFKTFRSIIGLPIRPPREFRQAQTNARLASTQLTESQIEEKINLRNQARANKDFAAADALRDELADAGVIIKDSKDGTTWEIK